MPAICAYCDAAAPLTREHLIPKAIMQRTKDQTIRYLAKADRLVGGEPTVRDVCSRCNNGVLSNLDAYACTLFDKYFSTTVHANTKVAFEYDYQHTVRWLLKMSYNAARTRNQSGAILLGRYKSFVLNGGTIPARLAVYLQLIIPHVLSADEEAIVGDRSLQLLPSMPNGRHYIAPVRIRIAESLPQGGLDGVLIRLIALNSYYFYLVLPRTCDLLPRQWKEMRHSTLQRLDGAVQLAEHRDIVQVRASRTDEMVANEFACLSTERAYAPWLRKHLKDLAAE